MGAFTTLGKTSKTVFLALENDKITQEFTVGATAVSAGMPVKLDANGAVVPWVKTDGEQFLIGYAHTDQAIGTLVTVNTRGFVLMYALSAGAVVPGPVTYEGYDTTTAIGDNLGYITVDDGSITVANCIGWALDAAAGAGSLIRVLMKN